MTGEFKYWDVNVIIETINEKGKVKKNREHHLVWGGSLQDVEEKVKAEMDGSVDPWSIKTVKESDIVDIYGKG